MARGVFADINHIFKLDGNFVIRIVLCDWRIDLVVQERGYEFSVEYSSILPDLLSSLSRFSAAGIAISRY